MERKERSKALKDKLGELQEALRAFLAAQTRYTISRRSPITEDHAKPFIRDKQDLFVSLVHKYARENGRRLEEIRVDILNAVDRAGRISQPPTLYRDLSALLERFSQDGKVAAEKRVLGTLAFDSMSARESRIAEAHKKTFEWVFDSNKTQFRPWLESEASGDVFWVTGKPGSGKSTLMKFLCSHDRTKATLQAWAGSGNKLVIASHFFWAAWIGET